MWMTQRTFQEVPFLYPFKRPTQILSRIAYQSIQQMQEALRHAEDIYINTSLYADEVDSQKVIELKLDHKPEDDIWYTAAELCW